MAEVEAGLAQAVAARPGLAQEVAGEALAAGGKRLRPLLCFLTARDEPSVAGRGRRRARAHGDARARRPRRRRTPAPWAAGRLVGLRRRRGEGRGRLPLRVRVHRARATGDEAAVATLADAALCLARGEAMQKLQTHDPDTPVDAYLERCGLKTGKLIEAACLLGSGGDERLGAYGLNLGIAFQIADDILDCAGETQQTGKIPGTDLREGTPTMPLLLAAAQNERRAARARRRAARRRAGRGRDDRRDRALA